MPSPWFIGGRNMKRKHRTRRDRLIYAIVLLIAMFPLVSVMLYLLGLNWAFLGFAISLPLIMLGFLLLWLRNLISHRNDVRLDRDYALGDDGEIVEIPADEQPKRKR